MFLSVTSESDTSVSLESFTDTAASPVLSASSPPVSTASGPAFTVPPATASAGLHITASDSVSAPASTLDTSVSITSSGGFKLPVPTSATADLAPLSTAPAVSPVPTVPLEVLTSPGKKCGSAVGQSVGDTATAASRPQSSTSFHSPPPAPVVASSAVTQLGLEQQQQILTQVAKPAAQLQPQLQVPLQSQVPAAQQQHQTGQLERQTAPQQYPVYQEQVQLKELALQQSLQQLQPAALQQQLPEVQALPLPGHVELLQQSKPLQPFLSPVPLQQPLLQQQTQFTQQLIQQPQLQQLPQQVIAAVAQQQAHMDHLQQHLGLQTIHLQQQQVQQLHMGAATLKPDQSQIQSLSISQQFLQQQLNICPVAQQQIPLQSQISAEPQHIQAQLQLTEPQQEVAKAVDTPPKQQMFPLMKQSSLQLSESEVSTGETSVTEDTGSCSAPLHPSSDSSLPPHQAGAVDTAVPTLSLTMTPSPAQPSSVAESDSEGPPKIEFVDNRIKTLDEKLRNLLYQEYSSGVASAGGAGPASAAFAAVGGDDSSEPQSLHKSFPPPVSSSDTSPHSSSSTTSSTTSRSSSTSPEPEMDAGAEVARATELGPVELHPCLPSASTSSTAPMSLLPPNPDDPAGPRRPPVPGEPTILVSV